MAPLTRGVMCRQVTRLESQVTRYKSSSEEAEKAEEDLKHEKRRLQKEVTCLVVLVSLIGTGYSTAALCFIASQRNLVSV